MRDYWSLELLVTASICLFLARLFGCLTSWLFSRFSYYLCDMAITNYDFQKFPFKRSNLRDLLESKL